MKISYAAWVLAMLAITSQFDKFAMAQDDTEVATTEEAAEETTAEAEEDAAEDEPEPTTETTEDPVADENITEEEEVVEETLPTGNDPEMKDLLPPDMYVLQQGAYNFAGFQIRKKFTEEQNTQAADDYREAQKVEDEKEDPSERVSKVELQTTILNESLSDELNPIKGRLDG